MKYIYLIPLPIGSSTVDDNTASIINSVDIFIVENAKTARAFLKTILTGPIQNAQMEELPNGKDETALLPLLEKSPDGTRFALLSEAGVPAVADPGSLIVKRSHQLGIRVIPLVGPSSIILALMASGLNGQSFCFNGYLPQKSEERIKRIREFETESQKFSRTQLFIETPYRNDQLLADLVKTLSPATLLSVACDLTMETEYIKTASVRDWQTSKIILKDRPAIFSFLCQK